MLVVNQVIKRLRVGNLDPNNYILLTFPRVLHNPRQRSRFLSSQLVPFYVSYGGRHDLSRWEKKVLLSSLGQKYSIFRVNNAQN